jgi:hypothetical protein
MEGDPTVKTTLPPFTVPIQNLLLLRVWFSGNSPKKFLPFILVNMVYCLLGSVIITS